MKISTFFSLLTATVLFCSANSSYAQENKLLAVSIERTSADTQTLVAVDCDQFKGMFKNSTKRYSIKAKSAVQNYEQSTKRFIAASESEKIDVRGIVIFTYRNRKIKYCFDRFGLFYGKGTYFKNQALIDLIQSLPAAG